MGNCNFHQKKLLQNLGGKESIIGKSVSAFMVNPNDDMDMPVEDTLLGCCVIGQAAAPEGVIEAYKSSQEAKEHEQQEGYGHQQEEQTHDGYGQQTHGGHQQQQSGGYGHQEQGIDDMHAHVYGGPSM